MRDNNPMQAASTMLTLEQTTNLAMIHDDNTQSGVTAEAILRSSVNDGSSESGQGAAMLMIIDDP